MNKNKMIGIIDGDVLLYRACHKSLKDNLDVKKTFDEIYKSVYLLEEILGERLNKI